MQYTESSITVTIGVVAFWILCSTEVKRATFDEACADSNICTYNNSNCGKDVWKYLEGYFKSLYDVDCTEQRSLNENCFSLDSEETQQCCQDNSECTKEENGYNFKYVCKENYDEVHGECENGSGHLQLNLGLILTAGFVSFLYHYVFI